MELETEHKVDRKRLAVRFNHRLTIQRQSTTQDALGQKVDTWTTIDYAWASLNPVSAKEYFGSSAERAEISHKIVMRYGVTIAPKDRIVYGARIFDINEVMNMREDNQYLLVMATERIA